MQLNAFLMRRGFHMSIDLKPCPFCGGLAHPPSDTLFKRVSCQNCGASGNSFAGNDVAIKKAIENWNARTASPDNAGRKVMGELINDMVIAHNMSHAAFCDSSYWKDEFQDKAKILIAVFNACDPQWNWKTAKAAIEALNASSGDGE
jgi:hypothetical protein